LPEPQRAIPILKPLTAFPPQLIAELVTELITRRGFRDVYRDDLDVITL
jgi:hypothetical protein